MENLSGFPRLQYGGLSQLWFCEESEDFHTGIATGNEYEFLVPKKILIHFQMFADEDIDEDEDLIFTLTMHVPRWDDLYTDLAPYLPNTHGIRIYKIFLAISQVTHLRRAFAVLKAYYK